jgi:hypothetical protein
VPTSHSRARLRPMVGLPEEAGRHGGSRHCGGRVRLIALIDEAALIEPILRYLALPTESPAPQRFITAATAGQSIVSRRVSRRTRPM